MKSDEEERASLDGLVFEQESDKPEDDYGSDMLDPNNLSDSDEEPEIGVKRDRSGSAESE